MCTLENTLSKQLRSDFSRRNFVSTVGIAAYLGECYSFPGLDQIGNLDNDALRGLTADPGLDL